jgi:ABC-type transport system substrate-binding protein
VPAADWLLPEAELRRFYQRDLEGARRLLREAGLEGGLDVTMPYLASSAVYATGGELIIAQLKEANIRVTARPLDYAAFSEQVLIRSEFEIAFGPGVGFSSADGALFGKYHSKGTRNYAKVNDPKLDEMIERQTVLGRRPDERKRLLQEIQRYILEQGYVHAVHSGEHLVGYQPYVRDLQAGGALASEPDRFTHVWLDK